MMNKNNLEKETENQSFELFQTKLIRTYKDFIKFCNTYGLKCWTCGGTAIGAVRHNNIIPWDDDIDVFMLRSDLERLYTMKHELQEAGFGCAWIKDYGYNHTYAKLYNFNTTIWETKNDPILFGLWIDIYPLYMRDGGTASNRSVGEVYSNKFMAYKRGIFRPTIPYILAPLRKLRFSDFWTRVMNLIYYYPKNKKFYNEFIEFEERIDQKDGPNFIQFMGITYYVFNRDWFENDEEYPFADFFVRTPQANQYLTYSYGNYMQLPPIENQKKVHNMYYVNLNERLSIGEVKKRIAKGICFE